MKPPTASPSCACTTLRKASRAVSRLYETRFDQTGMTVTQFAILRALDRQGETPLSRLAEAMVMDRTSLYRTIAPIERSGWLDVAPGPGRSRLARLTTSGREAMLAVAPVWDEAQAAFLERFGREAWLSLSATLAQVIDAAGSTPA